MRSVYGETPNIPPNIGVVVAYLLCYFSSTREVWNSSPWSMRSGVELHNATLGLWVRASHSQP